MMRLKSDLVDLILSGLSRQLDKIEAKWEDKFAIGVILASFGYPDSPRKGDIISGLESVSADIKIFHSGTSIKDNELYTAGGRVLCVVGMENNIELAQKSVYNAISKIKFNGMQYRKDIANSAIKC